MEGLLPQWQQQVQGVVAGGQWQLKSVHDGRRVCFSKSWCKSKLLWQVLYDAVWPQHAPDVLTHDDSFLPLLLPPSSCPAVLRLQSMLRAWSKAQHVCATEQLADVGLTSDPYISDGAARQPAITAQHDTVNSLQQLLDVLLLCFVQWQQHRVRQLGCDRLNFEIETVSPLPGVEVQIVAATSSSAADEVVFKVPLPDVQCQPLQPPLTAATSHDAPSTSSPSPLTSSLSSTMSACLLAQFVAHSTAAPTLELQVKGWTNEQVAQVQLPPWRDRGCLLEYIPLATAAVQQRVDDMAAAQRLPSDLLQELALRFGAPLELNEAAQSATYLLAHGGTFLFVLHVQLTPAFPQSPPQLTLQNLSNGSALGTVVLQDIPWSPRWSAREMVRRISTALRERIPPWKANFV